MRTSIDRGAKGPGMGKGHGGWHGESWRGNLMDQLGAFQMNRPPPLPDGGYDV